MCSDNPTIKVNLSRDLDQLTDGEILRRIRRLFKAEAFPALRRRYPRLNDIEIVDAITRAAALSELLKTVKLPKKE